MIELPSDLVHGLVVGRYIQTKADGTDEDRLPDAIPASGTVYFSPTSNTVVSLSGEPTTILKHTPEAVLDANGRLSDNGTPGIWLGVGVYTVTFKLTQGTVPPFKIEVKPENGINNPVDLPSYMPIPSGPTLKWVVNEKVYLDALKARDEAVAAASGVSGAIEDVVERYLEENPPAGGGLSFTVFSGRQDVRDAIASGQVSEGDIVGIENP